jgi:hypothetical protein
MSNTLFSAIMKHVDLMDALTKESKLLISACQDKDIDKVEFITENRQRMTALLDEYQLKVEKITREMPAEQLSTDAIAILKTWFNDLNQWVERYLELDGQILSILEQFKNETSQEIGAVYKSKNSHKAYNLSNVKK